MTKVWGVMWGDSALAILREYMVSRSRAELAELEGPGVSVRTLDTQCFATLVGVAALTSLREPQVRYERLRIEERLTDLGASNGAIVLLSINLHERRHYSARCSSSPRTASPSCCTSTPG